MKTKKHPKANLENYSKLFVQLGIVLSLLVAYALLETKTFEKDIVVFNSTSPFSSEEIPQIVEFRKQKPIQPKQKKINIDIIKKVIDDSPADDLFFTDVIDDPVDFSDFNDVVDEEPELPEDEVDFIVLEDAPSFPGCTGSKEEMKACFTNEINKFIRKKFDTGLAEKIGLSSGIQRIYTLFKIDKNGNIIDIQARAPHQKLKEEAVRVIKLLPKMKPGKQRGHPVIVKFSLPIVFKVE